MDNQSEQLLCDRVGEPFYLAHPESFREAVSTFKRAFRKFFPRFEVGYSYKTNPLHVFCREANRMGVYAEVVSPEELSLARHLGVHGSRIIFNGPCKDEQSIRWCIEQDALINIDSWRDLETVEELVRNDRQALKRIGVRLNFTEAGLVSRFGFDAACPETLSVFRRLSGMSPDCDFILHSHVADRSLESVKAQTVGMSDFFRQLVSENIRVSGFNLGGGFMSNLSEPLRLSLAIEQVSFEDYAETIHQVFGSCGIDVESFDFYAEPGTAVVAGSLSLFGQVIDLRKRSDGSTIATTNLSRFDAYARATLPDLPCRLVTNELRDPPDADTILTGYTCIESDILHTRFPYEVRVGDWIVFDDVGSYSTVFKPPFIKGAHPVLSLQESGAVYVERHRQTWDHMFPGDLIESNLL